MRKFKKSTLILLALFVVAALSLTAFAATGGMGRRAGRGFACLSEEEIAAKVESGELTQEQADEIAARMDKMKERPEGFGRRAPLSEEEIAAKVESGELTQEQADEILTRMDKMKEKPEGFKKHGRGFGGKGGFGRQKPAETNSQSE